MAAALAISAPASAADIGRKAPTPFAPVVSAFTWTGFYAGINAGYSWGDYRTRLGLGGAWATESVALQNEFAQRGGGTLRPTSFIGGIQAGYNYQFGRAVAGLEADINFLDLRKRTAYGGPTVTFPALTYNYTRGVDTSWLVTVRPRLGYTFDRTLIYATGGIAFAEVKDRWSVASNGNYLKSLSNSTVRVGWTIGGGVEHAFLNNWSIKAEYLYTDLGRSSKNSVYLPGSAFLAPPYTEQVKTKLTFHTVRVGVNYRF